MPRRVAPVRGDHRDPTMYGRPAGAPPHCPLKGRRGAEIKVVSILKEHGNHDDQL